MHHAALDGAGAHKRHFDDQIVKAARPHPRQKVHLRPAFDLKHPQTVGPRQHVIDCRVFGWQGRQIKAWTMMPGDQIEPAPDAGQHAQRQDVDLEYPQPVDIILVPRDDGAPLHRGVFDRGQLVQPAFGDDESPNML